MWWPGGVILKHLLDWWQLRFIEYDRKAYAAMKSESPETHPHYWDAVSCVHMSRVTVAVEVEVMLHCDESNRRTTCIDAVKNIVLHPYFTFTVVVKYLAC